MAVFFDAPERFVTGTIGAPGARTFFVQVRQGDRLVSVMLEKVQVRLLGERLADIIEGVRSLGETEVPELPGTARDLGPLDAPLDEFFRVGDIRIGWDRSGERIVIELADDSSDELLGVRLTLLQTQEFIDRAQRTVASGRPTCPFCAQPVDASGHICPRANGYRGALFP